MNWDQQVSVLLVKAKSSWKNYLLKGLLTVALILPPAGLTFIFKPSLLIYHTSLLYLLIVVAIAFAFGQFFAFLATIAAFICLDIFFTQPYNNITVSQSKDALSLLVFFLIALITGIYCSEVGKRYYNTRTNLYLQKQKSSEEVVQRAYQMRILYQMSVETNCEKSFKGQLSIIVQALVESFASLGVLGCILFFPDGEKKPVAQVIWPQSSELAKCLSNTDVLATVTSMMSNAANKDVIRLDVEENSLPIKNNMYRRIVGSSLQRSNSTHHWAYVLPGLMIEGRIATLLLLAEESSDHPSLTKQGLFDWEQPNLHAEFLRRFIDHILSVAEKARLLNEKLEVEMLQREENIHTDLNKWVSHGIRTPLTTIKPEITKAISTVREGDLLDNSLLTSLEKIKNAIDRLDLFVDDLLDMARAKGGILKPKKSYIGLMI